MKPNADVRFVEGEICNVEKYLGDCHFSGKSEFIVRTEHGSMTVQDTGYEFAGIPCSKLIERSAPTAMPAKSAAA